MSSPVAFKQKEHSSTGLTEHYLRAHGTPYKLFEHDERFSAAAEAMAAGVTPENAVKCILLRDRDGYRLAVIPASERLDLKRLRELLGVTEIRFATEEEMATDFPAFEVGALPPLGLLLNASEVIDGKVLDHTRVLCNAGDHRHSMLVDPRDIADLAHARIGDICEE